MQGIAFTGVMISAIMALEKDITRRLTGLGHINQMPQNWVFDSWIFKAGSRYAKFKTHTRGYHNAELVRCPWNVNGIYYMRESFFPTGDPEKPYIYRQQEPGHDVRWTTSRFMPANAARCWFRVLDVGCDRVQAISEEESRREGADFYRRYMATAGNKMRYPMAVVPESSRGAFGALWNSVHLDKPGESFDCNPFCFDLTLELLRQRPVIGGKPAKDQTNLFEVSN